MPLSRQLQFTEYIFHFASIFEMSSNTINSNTINLENLPAQPELSVHACTETTTPGRIARNHFNIASDPYPNKCEKKSKVCIGIKLILLTIYNVLSVRLHANTAAKR